VNTEAKTPLSMTAMRSLHRAGTDTCLAFDDGFEVMSTLERVVQERGSRVKRILEIGRIRWIVKPVSGAFCETTFLLFMGQRGFLQRTAAAVRGAGVRAFHP